MNFLWGQALKQRMLFEILMRQNGDEKRTSMTVKYAQTEEKKENSAKTPMREINTENATQ